MDDWGNQRRRQQDLGQKPPPQTGWYRPAQDQGTPSRLAAGSPFGMLWQISELSSWDVTEMIGQHGGAVFFQDLIDVI